MKIIVKGNSMEPAMYEGETYIAVKFPTRKLKVGDVVVADINGKMVVKRISKIVAKGYLFDIKGDNKCSNNFKCVFACHIKAKVICPTLWTLLVRRCKNVKKEK